jgi:hypothetical protein
MPKSIGTSKCPNTHSPYALPSLILANFGFDFLWSEPIIGQ